MFSSLIGNNKIKGGLQLTLTSPVGTRKCKNQPVISTQVSFDIFLAGHTERLCIYILKIGICNNN